MADSNELKLLLKIDGVETLGKLRDALKSAKKELATLPTESKEFQKLAQQISITGTRIGELSQATLTANGRMMQSYFRLGQQLRASMLAGGGLDGVIRQLAMSIGMLQTKGVAMDAMLKGVIRSAFTPFGIAVLAATAGLAAYNKLTSDAEAKEKAHAESLKKINQELEKQKKLRADIMDQKYDLGDTGHEERLKQLDSEIDALMIQLRLLTEISRVRGGQFGGIAPVTQAGLKVPRFITAPALSTGVTVAPDQEKLASQGSTRMQLESEILELRKKRQAVEGAISKAADDAHKKFLQRQKAEYQNEEERLRLESEGMKYREEIANELARVEEEKTKESLERQKQKLKDLSAAYNSNFFDPLRAGFRAVSDEIRQGLFGSLDDLKAKFGNVGAAIIQSLNQVIVKLIEMSLAASILSLFPGAGNFGAIFMSLLKPGSLTTPTKNSTGDTNDIIAGRLVGGGSVAQQVQVVVQGKLSGGDIYLSGKNYESLQYAVKG